MNRDFRKRSRQASLILSAAAIVAICPISHAALPAFPGADGAGGTITGGRGGVVYHVTRLDGEINGNRTVPGTLAYGLNDSNFTSGGTVQPRTIVFDVGGTIWLGQKGGTEGWDTQDPLSAGSQNSIASNITIAGQTAPGGITLMGGGLKVNGNNTIVRNLSIAPGYGIHHVNTATGYADLYTFDGMNIHANNVMVDHVSAFFGTDETISMDEFANNLTVQYTNMAQGQNYPQADAQSGGAYTGHALGSLIQPNSNAKISVIHNLYAHLKGRLPRVGTTAGSLSIAGVGAMNDFRNNVFYNWYDTAGTGASAQPSSNNFVGNFYLAGPGGDDNSGSLIVNKAGGTGIFNGNSGPTNVYHTGNLKDTNKDGDALDGVALTNGDFSGSVIQASPYAVPYLGITDTGTAAFNRVLNYAGANWNNRSTVDARIVSEARTGTGRIVAFADPTHGTEWNALLALRMDASGVAPFNRPANFDTDQDGMPDTWEVARGLDPAVANNNGDFDSDGYTDLEEYLNELAAWPAPTALTWQGGSGRYALSSNWPDNQWQPSRYDVVKINSGIAMVDSVSQDAGTLLVGVDPGSSGVLAVTSGWIAVANQLQVGSNSGSVGTVTLSGGTIHVGQVARVGNTGTIEFTGGAIDIGSGIGIFDYTASSPLALVQQQITSGFAAGAWTGSGIDSFIAATVAADPLNTHKTGLGYAEASQLPVGATFLGQSIDSTTVLIRYTYYGDSNLDGTVDSLDFNALAANFGSSGRAWVQGDYNYDGLVDSADFNALAANYGLSLAAPPNSIGTQIIPEPAAISIIVVTSAMILSRRRR